MARSNSPRLYKVVLNGVTILDDSDSATTKYVISIEGERVYSESIKECEIIVNSQIGNVVTIDESIGGKTITIQRGSTTSTDVYIFRGEVIGYKQAPNGYVLTCKNKYFKAQKREVTYSYDETIDAQGGVGSEIFKDLIDSYTDLQYGASTVQSTGTANVLNKFVCNHDSVYERGAKLADVYNFQHYYNDYDDYVYFEPIGYVDSGVTLTVGQEIVNVPEWDFNHKKIINELTIIGSPIEVQETKFADGDNTEGQTVQLDYIPTSAKVFVGSGAFNPSGGTKPSDVPTNIKTGGKTGSTSGSFDYDYDPDKKIKTVYFYDSTRGTEPSYTPPSGTNNIEVQYSRLAPIAVYGKDETSESNYGLSTITIKTDNIKSVSDGEIYLNRYLQKYKDPIPSTTLLVDGVADIRAGRKYTIVDSKNSITRELIVTKHKFFYPYKADEVSVGYPEDVLDEFEVNIWDRIKDLERKESETGDLLIQLFPLTASVTFENRYFEQQIKNIAGTTLVWGHSIYGLWGGFKWGSDTESSFVLGHETFGILGSIELGASVEDSTTTVKIIQGKDTYKEYFYDEDFNSANTTGDWNTSTKQCELDTGEILETSTIFYDSSSTDIIQAATLTITNTGDTPTAYMTADGGSNWELVTLGTKHTFINSGSDLRIKLNVAGPGWPTMFGAWGSALQSTITYIQCIYELV